MASITIYLQCCFHPSTNNTTTEQNRTNTHPRDPRRRPTSHDRSQHENKGQLFQLIRTFTKKVGVWKENASEVISLMQLISNSNFYKVMFTVTAQRIQNVLNENRSQLGFRLTKIGTMFAIPLLTSDPSDWSRRSDMSYLSPYQDVKVQYVSNHGIRFPGRYSA
jgi:hypothetical protein